jgi:hypothetical protein
VDQSSSDGKENNIVDTFVGYEKFVFARLRLVHAFADSYEVV